MFMNLLPPILFFGGLLWLNATLKRRKRERVEAPSPVVSGAPPRATRSRRGGGVSTGLLLIGATALCGGGFVALNAYEKLRRTMFHTDELRIMFWGGAAGSAVGLGLMIAGAVVLMSRRADD